VRGIELDSTGTMRVLVGKPDEPSEQAKALAK
jgi:hypothetical protein